MGKQTKELHAATKIVLDAWQKSETLNQNVEAELRVVTAELQTAKSELQSVKGELQAMKECMEDESAKTNENLEAIAAAAATRNSPSVSYANVARSGLGGQGRDSRVATPGNATLSSRSDSLFCRIRAAVEKEMRAMDGQGSWRCRAVTVVPRTRKKDMPKAYGSMVVFVTKASDARRLISEGFFHGGGESSTTMAFERRPRPQQCYNCQQITRHKANQCVNTQVDSMVPAEWREQGRWGIRSLLWVNNEVETEQVPIASPDITAAVVRLPDRRLLVASVYVPVQNPEMLRRAYNLLKQAIANVLGGTGERVDVLRVGDSNCHDYVWGGDDVSEGRQGEADPIINPMSEYSLRSLLPRGTRTWEKNDAATTIDLSLASEEQARTVLRQIHTHWRNQTRAERRTGNLQPELEKRARSAAKQYHDVIRQQKKSYWEDFLADDTNIWKAAKYPDGSKGASFDKITQLKEPMAPKREMPQNRPKSCFPHFPLLFLARLTRRGSGHNDRRYPSLTSHWEK
ncbi:hypothetical protein CLIM01_13913 [Colletotrichum limetticola]|uniref:Endonuclease/exonuclease/phosphatase domain-containing protein n=1 Tax=Colletotrichum limetticola TaxID=1209924 RepID=A0ABQ9PD32_9PEZI|nr:hypothetical protein CLIM01_13913 [Colletotrichum limetticola]